MLALRTARMADADLLFQWANEARPWSRSTVPISREGHDRWMKLNVEAGYPAHWVLIIENDVFGPVGMIRFDMVKRDVMSYVVSIIIDPEHRGKGFGRDALGQACNLVMPECLLLAEIRNDNIASISIFRKCGFDDVGKDGDFVQFCREPL